ncbi:MAG: hypothetical protein ACTSWJ_02340 [Candidatus Heimdallarchaeaceae archaeon]
MGRMMLSMSITSLREKNHDQIYIDGNRRNNCRATHAADSRVGPGCN